MSDQNEIEGGVGAKTGKPDVPDAVRRRFATAGLIAPVILTLSGRTAWATGWHGGGGNGGNCSESGMLSGNLSDPNPTVCGGEGCTPGYWKNHVERWHPNYPPTASFHSVFGVDAFPGATLYSVVCENAVPQVPGNCTPNQNCVNLLKSCGKHAVAALQNAATDVSYVFDTLLVRAKFASVYANGSKTAIEWQKNEFDIENNRGCPLS